MKIGKFTFAWVLDYAVCARQPQVCGSADMQSAGVSISCPRIWLRKLARGCAHAGISAAALCQCPLRRACTIAMSLGLRAARISSALHAQLAASCRCVITLSVRLRARLYPHLPTYLQACDVCVLAGAAMQAPPNPPRRTYAHPVPSRRAPSHALTSSPRPAL